MAQDYNADNIVKVVSALTNLFRIALSKGGEMLAVSEELEHVRSYMIIQKARYEDKMEYEIKYDEETLKCRVLKLILQPLVENAIYHGVKEKRGTGKISISAKRADNKLLLCVKENGAGITSKEMEELKKMLDESREEAGKPGYGEFNVNERIRLSFGNEYGLRVISIQGEGTTVEVWHPIVEG